jgi:hypothetical protein
MPDAGRKKEPAHASARRSTSSLAFAFEQTRIVPIGSHTSPCRMASANVLGDGSGYVGGPVRAGRSNRRSNSDVVINAPSTP